MSIGEAYSVHGLTDHHHMTRRSSFHLIDHNRTLHAASPLADTVDKDARPVTHQRKEDLGDQIEDRLASQAGILTRCDGAVVRRDHFCRGTPLEYEDDGVLRHEDLLGQLPERMYFEVGFTIGIM